MGDESTLISRSGSKLTARPLVSGDVEKLQAFHRSLSEETKSRFTPHAYDAETISTYIARSASGEDLILVLQSDTGEIVGYFFLWEFQEPVPLLGIGLADEWQGEGLGPQLMQLLIDHARAADREGIELTTVPDNERAYRLYESCGFDYLGDVENVAGDGRVVVERRMFLPLTPGATPPVREFKPPV